MPVTVHKILWHGDDVIEHFGITPIGVLTEEAQESRNKDFKRFREYNTRKCSRIVTNLDLLHKLLISSDPYISSMRQTLKKAKLIMNEKAIDLLVINK